MFHMFVDILQVVLMVALPFLDFPHHSPRVPHVDKSNL